MYPNIILGTKNGQKNNKIQRRTEKSDGVKILTPSVLHWSIHSLILTTVLLSIYSCSLLALKGTEVVGRVAACGDALTSDRMNRFVGIKSILQLSLLWFWPLQLLLLLMQNERGWSLKLR